jgi:hypothetical protein
MDETRVLSDDAVVEIVERDLPRWKEACNNPEAAAVILTQNAFGNSEAEMFLLAVAVKYAGILKKDVTVTA